MWDGTLDSGRSSPANPLTLAALDGNRALRAWLIDSAVARSTNVWSAAPSSSDWNDARNWNLLSAPVAGQTAILTNSAAVILTNATPHLAALALDSGTLTCDGWDTCLQADDIKLNNGLITHKNNSATAPDGELGWVPNARVWLKCDTIAISSNAQINVDGKGYGGLVGLNGTGPGGGKKGDNGSGGGGHGGRGGNGWNGTGGNANDSLTTPAQPGSSGGGTTYSVSETSAGSSGGGVVRIEANGAVVVNGAITANGSDLTTRAGAGAGGAVHITCQTFAGSGGAISANGGKCSGYGGGGSGGRIVIDCNASAQALLAKPRVTISANYGQSGYNVGILLGTLWLSDTALPDPAWLPHSGTLHFGNMELWQADNFIVSGGRLTLYGADNVKIKADSDFLVSGAATEFFMREGMIECQNLTVTNGAAMYSGFLTTTRLQPSTTTTVIRCHNNLTIATNSTLGIYPAVTNGPAGANYGALIDVGRRLAIAAGGSLLPYSSNTNGATTMMRMETLEIAPGGIINANAKGYAGALQSYAQGFGPGAGKANGDNFAGGGGGYGGAGGKGKSAGGPSYGSALFPFNPGSGGGNGNGTGGYGGSAVRIEARQKAIVNGTITANGNNGGGQYGIGSGSGGGIYIRTPKLFGGSGAILRANGGSEGGGGGGGRIAIWHGQVWDEDVTDSRIVVSESTMPATWQGAFPTVAGGASANYTAGQNGTIRIVTILPRPSTIIMLR